MELIFNKDYEILTTDGPELIGYSKEIEVLTNYGPLIAYVKEIDTISNKLILTDKCIRLKEYKDLFPLKYNLKYYMNVVEDSLHFEIFKWLLEFLVFTEAEETLIKIKKCYRTVSKVEIETAHPYLFVDVCRYFSIPFEIKDIEEDWYGINSFTISRPTEMNWMNLPSMMIQLLEYYINYYDMKLDRTRLSEQFGISNGGFDWDGVIYIPYSRPELLRQPEDTVDTEIERIIKDPYISMPVCYKLEFEETYKTICPEDFTIYVRKVSDVSFYGIKGIVK